MLLKFLENCNFKFVRFEENPGMEFMGFPYSFNNDGCFSLICLSNSFDESKACPHSEHRWFFGADTMISFYS
jgi:hypothetical protein